MPPRRPLGKPFQPPPDWRVTHQRLQQYRHSLPDRDAGDASSWWRSSTCAPETRRYHLLVGLMLSSLAREATCSAVMHRLLRDELTPRRVHAMDEKELRERIKTISLCNTKAKHIKQTTEILLRDYDGKVPRAYDEVIALPGVGPKMANLFFPAADNRVVGFAVDTHVHRLTQRLGWVPPSVKSPEDTRKCVESWLPRDCWQDAHFNLVTLGQKVCRSRHPKCDECCVRDHCPSATTREKK